MIHRMRGEQGDTQWLQARNGCFAIGYRLQAFARQPVQAGRQSEVPPVVCEPCGCFEPGERVWLTFDLADGGAQVWVFG